MMVSIVKFTSYKIFAEGRIIVAAATTSIGASEDEDHVYRRPPVFSKVARSPCFLANGTKIHPSMAMDSR